MILRGSSKLKRQQAASPRKLKLNKIHSYSIFKTYKKLSETTQDTHYHLPQLDQPPGGKHLGMKFLFW